MATVASDPLTSRVVELLHQGHTLDQVASRLGLHRSNVYRRKLAAGLPRRWTPLSDRERRRIRDLINADYSRREVARRVHRGLGTVARVAVRLQNHGSETYRATRSVYRCPGCGTLINIRPCLICAAKTHARSSQASASQV